MVDALLPRLCSLSATRFSRSPQLSRRSA
jgi:hypothetical protein